MCVVSVASSKGSGSGQPGLSYTPRFRQNFGKRSELVYDLFLLFLSLFSIWDLKICFLVSLFICNYLFCYLPIYSPGNFVTHNIFFFIFFRLTILVYRVIVLCSSTSRFAWIVGWLLFSFVVGDLQRWFGNLYFNFFL